MKTVTTQSKEWLLNRLIEQGLYGTKEAQEFLSISSVYENTDLYGETERYFFKYVTIFGFKELRLFKESKRVTTSIKRTKP